MGPLDSTTILIADDERAVRMLMRIVLEGAGATVVEAADGAQARRLLESSPSTFDVLVTDMNMPAMDGEALVRWARANWAATLPVVLVSATGTLAHHPLIAEGMVQAALAKPFNPQSLVRAVSDVVDCSRTAAAV